MFILQKIISLSLFSPLPIILIIFFIALTTFKKYKKRSIILIIISLCLYLFSIDAFVDKYLYKLENSYSSIDNTSLEKGQIYVLLGGGIVPVSAGGHVPTVNAESRILKTIILYKKFPKKIFISGGKPLQNYITESKVYKDILIDSGIPEIDIVEEDNSNTTKENAQFIANLTNDKNITSIILITSASHMKRSINIFQKYMPNIEITPCPSNFLASNRKLTIFSFIPKFHNYFKSSILLWETLGNFYYKLRY